MPGLKLIKDVELQGKTVVLRIDINSPLKQGKPVLTNRIKKHAKTINFLANKGAKLVVLGHQGRKGRFNYSSLEEHSKLLSQESGKQITFVSFEGNWLDRIKNMQKDEIILLDNVRFFEDELMPSAKYVQELLPLTDVFVLDAFSICHRNHASVVGFKSKPCYAGPVLEEEYNALQKIENKNKIYFLGGAKVEDTLYAAKEVLKSSLCQKIYFSGLPAKFLLRLKKYSFGKDDLLLRNFDNLKELGQEILQYIEKIQLPLDFASSDNGLRTNVSLSALPVQKELLDIGEKTISLFSQACEKAEAIVFNGAPGVYESQEYRKGTCSLLKAIAQSPALSFIGGGDTDYSLQLCEMNSSLFFYTSISGKAMLDYLAGLPLPGLEILFEN